jgi:hypothetical protein
MEKKKMYDKKKIMEIFTKIKNCKEILFLLIVITIFTIIILFFYFVDIS